MLGISCSLHAQEWKLEKNTDKIQAYSAQKNGSPIKMYKLIAEVSASSDCLCKSLTDYPNYQELFNGIAEFKVLVHTDTLAKTYTLLDFPWPMADREVYSEIAIQQLDDGCMISSKAFKYKEASNESVVRLTTFSEQYRIQTLKDTSTEIILTGHADLGGTVPAWFQNAFIITEPINLIGHLEELCLQNN